MAKPSFKPNPNLRHLLLITHFASYFLSSGHNTPTSLFSVFASSVGSWKSPNFQVSSKKVNFDQCSNYSFTHRIFPFGCSNFQIQFQSWLNTFLPKFLPQLISSSDSTILPRPEPCGGNESTSFLPYSYHALTPVELFFVQDLYFLFKMDLSSLAFTKSWKVLWNWFTIYYKPKTQPLLFIQRDNIDPKLLSD